MSEQNESLADCFADWLREQGHEPQIELQGEGRATVRFRARGNRYVMYIDEADRTFCNFVSDYRLPDWLNDDLTTLRLAASVQKELKAVKVSIWPEQRTVRFEVEQFLEFPSGLALSFWRLVSIVDDASNRFFRYSEAHRPEPAQVFIASLEGELAEKPGESQR
jgi:hypothetical protein